MASAEPACLCLPSPLPTEHTWGGQSWGGQGAEFDHMPFRYQVREVGWAMQVSAEWGGATHIRIWGTDSLAVTPSPSSVCRPLPAWEPGIQPQDRLVASVRIPVLQ